MARSVGLVEDNELLSVLIKDQIEHTTDITVTAFQSAEQALQAEDWQSIGAWILDNKLPGMSGMELGIRICEVNDSARILMLSNFISSASLRAVPITMRFRWGFVRKESILEARQIVELLEASQQMSITRGLTEHSFMDLTPKEVELLEYVALGLRTQAIAEREGQSVKSVEAQLTSLYQKLNITASPDHNVRVVAAKFGWTMGLVASTSGLIDEESPD